MKTLVIGGSGFIGSHVVDALVASSRRVRVFNRAPERFRSLPPGVEFLSGSITNTVALAEALADTDTVYHLVSTTVPSTANLDPVADIEGNLIPAIKLLKLMRDVKIKRLVYLSSGGTVYGIPNAIPVPETHPLNPINSYGIVKVAVENFLAMEAHLHGLRPLILRASNPYGPRQGYEGVQGVIGTSLWRLANDKPIQIWGDGSVVRDFIHVADLARLCVEAERAGVTGILNAGSGRGHSVRNVVDTIARVTGRPLELVYQPSRGYDVPRVVLDISRARRETGWGPTTGLAEGIAQTWNWVRARKGLA